MAGGSISINPYLTSNAGGGFNTSSSGFVQGVFLDDPALRNELAGGTYDPAATVPLIGGVPIAEYIRDNNNVAGTVPNYQSSLGGFIKRATSLSAAAAANVSTALITGFSVLNGAFQGVTTPQSPAPSFGAGGSVGFLRLGSGMRLPVAMDPGLVSSTGSLITSFFSWDFNNDRLAAYDAATATVAISSMTYATTNGGQIAVVASAATNVQAVGDAVNISGATTTGTGGNTAVNGNFIVNTFTDNQHFTVAATNAGGAAYYGTISVGSAVLNQGVGNLPVKVLEFDIGNSMTTVYDAVNNVYGWNRTGSCALIQL